MTNEPGTFTLTSPAGRFFFSTEVILSHAKLVRDTITASFMGALGDTPRVTKERNPVTWIRTYLDGPARDTPFEWEPPSLAETIQRAFDSGRV